LSVSHRLAQSLNLQQKPREALPYAQRALTGRLKLLGKDHPETQGSQLLVNELTRWRQAPSKTVSGAGVLSKTAILPSHATSWPHPNKWGQCANT